MRSGVKPFCPVCPRRSPYICPMISPTTRSRPARRWKPRLSKATAEKLTHPQAARLLGLTRFEFDGFLKDRKIYDRAYSIKDLERDLAELD